MKYLISSVLTHYKGLGLAIAMVALVSGCATPTQPASMAALPSITVHQSNASVSIEVTGGSETSSTGTSRISNQDFHSALEKSIIDSGLFSSVTTSENADYQLEAYIAVLSQPMMGFSMTVSLEVAYRLKDLRNDLFVLEKNVDSTYTAAAGEAFAGVVRLRLATEGAAKMNIQKLLETVSELQLD